MTTDAPYSTVGRHELRTGQPLDVAESLAREMGARLVLPEDAERVLASMAALLHPDTPTHLLRLAANLAKAERIVARTEARALVLFEQALSDGTGLELHPQTLRDAADAVRAARAAVARAEAELVTFEREAAATAAEAGAAEAASEPATAAPLATSPVQDDGSRRSRLGAIVAIALGIALILTGTALVPAYLAAILPLAAVAYVVRELRGGVERVSSDYEAVASEQLASIEALSTRLYGAMPATQSAVDAATARRRQLLELDRDTATERLRVAERTWRELAGPDADPEAVEELLLRRDPQRHRAAPWVRESAAVRAAETMHERARSAWRAAWEALDREAPSAADADDAVRHLANDAAAVVSERRPVVIVAPPDEVDDQLTIVAERLAVVVVTYEGD